MYNVEGFRFSSRLEPYLSTVVHVLCVPVWVFPQIFQCPLDLLIWKGFRLHGHVGVDMAVIYTPKLDKTQHMRETSPAQSSNGGRLFINEDPCGALLNTAGQPEIRGTTSD